MTDTEPVLAAFGGAIDVHAHYLPSAYRDALEHNGHTHPDGIPFGLPSWSPSAHVDLMDALGIATSLLSISSPGLLLTEDLKDAIDLTRRVNDQGAELARTQPSRFGLFASLPLPNVDASLAEATRAMDELGADGISVLTNYAGQYLGDERFDPVFDELSRRNAIVTIHPTSPACWEAVSFGRSRATVEFMIDTARAVANLALSGTIDRCPGIRFVVPHGGGALTVLADRIARTANRVDDTGIDVIAGLRRQYYDTAGGPIPRQLPALLNLVDVSQVVYGSDFPFSNAAGVTASTEQLAECDLLSKEELGAVFRGNCLELFPRLSS